MSAKVSKADVSLMSGMGGKRTLATVLDFNDVERTQVCAPSYLRGRAGG